MHLWEAHDDKDEVKQHRVADDALTSAKSWDDLKLSVELRKGILDKGFVKPSRIQEMALPLIITQNRNIIAQAQNGSGKTATFALGLLSKIEPLEQTAQVV